MKTEDRTSQIITDILHCDFFKSKWVIGCLEKGTNEDVLEARQYISKNWFVDLETADKVIELIQPKVKERKNRVIATIKSALLTSGKMTEDELTTVQIEKNGDGCWDIIKNGEAEHLGFDMCEAINSIYCRQELANIRNGIKD